MICNLHGHNCSVLSLHVSDTTASSAGRPPHPPPTIPRAGQGTHSKLVVGQASSTLMQFHETLSMMQTMFMFRGFPTTLLFLDKFFKRLVVKTDRKIKDGASRKTVLSVCELWFWSASLHVGYILSTRMENHKWIILQEWLRYPCH